MEKLLRKKMFSKKGFTILELLVVVAIIAILAVIAVPQFLGAIEKSRVSAQIADLNSINKAVVMYNFDTSAYPVDISKLQNDTVTGFNGPYMNAVPAKSKWGGDVTFAAVSTADGTTIPEDIKTGKLIAATQTATKLAVGNECIIVDCGTAAEATKVDTAIDQTPGADSGVIRTSGQYLFYVVH